MCEILPPRIDKQLVLNRLPLNDDILYLIKRFSFYDMETMRMRRVIQERMKHIAERIKHAISRNTCEFGEHWAFGFLETSMETLQLQATNCAVCGNYFQTGHAQTPWPRSILCQCVYS